MKIEVIGGSIAGLEFARRLKALDREDLFRVTVYEEHARIGDAVRCAEGWVYAPGIGEPPHDCVRMAIHEGVLRFLDAGYQVIDQIETPLSGRAWVVDRPTYERRLAQECLECGVEVVTAARKTILECAERADLVVDGSGCPSQFQRECGRPTLPAIGFQYELAGDFSIFSHRLTTDVMAGQLGFWVFPKGTDRANVGVWWYEDGPAPGSPRKRLHEYMEAHLPREVSVVRTAGGGIGVELQHPLYYAGRKTVLVGDAAGLAEPFSGEGMTSAMVSARLLAESVKEASLELYELRILAALGPKLAAGRLTRVLWGSQRFEEFTSTLRSLRGMALKDRVARLQAVVAETQAS